VRQEAKLLHICDVFFAEWARPYEDREVSRVFVDSVFKHATAALDFYRQIDYEVARNIESIHAEDLAETINVRVRSFTIADRVELM